MTIKKITAYTLTELMVTVATIGFLASFAMPNYARAIARGREREAQAQLVAIHAAEQIYRTLTNGTYWPNLDCGAQTIIQINANLGLNIIENDMTFTCSSPACDGSDFNCQATGGGATITVTEAPLSAANPSCVGCN